MLAPFYRRRAERLATEALKARMPLTQAEIAADKDRLRALYAIDIHRLEKKIEKSENTTAKQLVELNRRDAAISALEGEVMRLRTGLEEHENARRVLEQTITDRLPKVEFRLSEAKKLLLQRDREIANLTVTSASRPRPLKRRRRSTPSSAKNSSVSTRRSPRAPPATAKPPPTSASTARSRFAPKSRPCATRLASRRHSLAASRPNLRRSSRAAGSAGTAEPSDTSAVKDTEAEIARLRKSLADAEGP